MTEQLTSGTWVVTGGSRGIGAAIAIAAARAGGRVAVLGRSTDQLDAVAATITADGGVAAAIRCDVADPDSVRSAIATAETELGPCDVLVNNAGIAPSAPLAKTSNDMWERTMAVNLHGTYYATRAVLGGMIERGRGRVINIASVAGKTGFPYTVAYCASKHAVIGLTRALAQEVATHGITVNAVCPGWVDTDMVATAVNNIAGKTKLTEEQARASLMARSPQQRMMTAEEVAGLVVYLSRHAARGINGQAINIDGGDLPV